MWPIISAITFYAMFGLLLLVLWQLARNIKVYAQAWATLARVNQQQADSMQKLADAVYILAKKLEG